MNFTQKDRMLREIEYQMKKEQLSMLKNLKEVEKNQVDNNFLRGVYEDYKTYKEHIIKQKQQHENTIKDLINYLEKNLLSNGLTDKMMRQAQFEQKELLDNLSSIRKELKDLILETN